MVERLLEAGADANAVAGGETALMTAARTGDVGAVKALLAHGRDVNATESWRGQTALMWAAIENNACRRGGADRCGSRCQPRSQGGFTALLLRSAPAASTQCVLCSTPART